MKTIEVLMQLKMFLEDNIDQGNAPHVGTIDDQNVEQSDCVVALEEAITKLKSLQ